MLIFLIKVFKNTLNKCSMTEYGSLKKCIFKHQSQISKNEQFQNYSSHKTLPHIVPRNTTFVPKFSMLPDDSIF